MENPGCSWSSQEGWGEPLWPRDPKLTSLPEKCPTSAQQWACRVPGPTQVQTHRNEKIHNAAFPTQRVPPGHQHHSDALSTSGFLTITLETGCVARRCM